MGLTDGRQQFSWIHPWSGTLRIIDLPSTSNIGKPGRFIWKVNDW